MHVLYNMYIHMYILIYERIYISELTYVSMSYVFMNACMRVCICVRTNERMYLYKYVNMYVICVGVYM